MKCAACGQETVRRLCHFCERTKQLIVARRCVTCTGPVMDDDVQNIQGRCGECRSRGVEPCAATRWLLAQAAAARYYRRPFALVEHRAAA